MNNYYGPDDNQYGRPPHRNGPFPPPAPPLRNPYKSAIRRNSNMICVGLVLIYVVMFFVAYISESLLDVFLTAQQRTDLHPYISDLQDLAIYVFSFAAPCLVIVLGIGVPGRAAFPMRRPKASLMIPALFFCLSITILGAYLSGMLSIILEQSFGLVQKPLDFPTPHGALQIIMNFISVALAPAILEEMVFRGAIMQSLRRYGDSFALITSAILFSMCHGNMIQAVPTFLLGLAIGYFVLRTGSLLTGMIIHFANNGLAILWDILFSPLPVEIGDSLYLGVYALYMLMGAASLVFLLVKHPRMFRTIPSNYPLTEPQKHAAFYITPGCIAFLILTFFVVRFSFVW